MKKLSIFILWIGTTLLMGACTSVQNTVQLKQSKVSINTGWKFNRLAKGVQDGSYHLSALDDQTWNSVRLPHTANIEPLVVNNQWQGISWYRKQLNVPSSVEGKKVFLEFDAAMNHSKIWINERLVADHQGGYLPIVIDATDYVKPGEKNIVAIRLDNRDNAVTGPKPLKILDFNMYGGLYRNAWMTVKNNVYISKPNLANKIPSGGVFITTPKVDEKQSQVWIFLDCLSSAITFTKANNHLRLKPW